MEQNKMEITNMNENKMEVTNMEQKMMNNGATEAQATTKVDILEEGVFIRPEAGQLMQGMTTDAYIENMINSLSGKKQVWAYVSESMIAVTSDSTKVAEFTTKLKKIWGNACCERVSGDVAIKTLKKQLSSIAKKWAVKDAIFQIEELGGKFEKGGCVLATSDDYKLVVNMFIDKERGSRYYQITEEKNGRKWGNQCKENRFKTKDMSDATKITSFLEERLGDYSESEISINRICTLIEKNRLIAVDEHNIINGEILDIEDVFKGFEHYIRSHISEKGIIAVKLRNGDIHVGIGASENKSASKNFDEVLDSIAPANNSRAVKSEMKKARMLKCDRADYQKTLSEVSCNIGDKIYSFNFNKEVLEELYKLYLDKMNSKGNTAA